MDEATGSVSGGTHAHFASTALTVTPLELRTVAPHLGHFAYYGYYDPADVPLPVSSVLSSA